MQRRGAGVLGCMFGVTYYFVLNLLHQPMHTGVAPLSLKKRIVHRHRWSADDIQTLEASYVLCKYPTSDRLNQLANGMNLSRRRVQVWFQNRRQRDRGVPSTEASPTTNEEPVSKRPKHIHPQPIDDGDTRVRGLAQAQLLCVRMHLNMMLARACDASLTPRSTMLFAIAMLHAQDAAVESMIRRVPHATAEYGGGES